MTTKYLNERGGTRTASEMRDIKRAAKHMNLDWRSIAARPRSAELLLARLHSFNLEAACRWWAESLTD